MKITQKYPQLFWDVKVENLDLSKDYQYVIERVLESGSVESVRDLLMQYGDDLIKEAIKTSRNISPKTATFWMHKLNIHEPIKCLQTQSPAQQNGLWK